MKCNSAANLWLRSYSKGNWAYSLIAGRNFSLTHCSFKESDNLQACSLIEIVDVSSMSVFNKVYGQSYTEVACLICCRSMFTS